MRLAVTMYQPKWTADIHGEWIRNVLANRPDITRAQLERTRGLMDAHGGRCLVTGYEPLIPLLTLPDPGDRHVLAAAITANAPTIVTFNLKHFPASLVGAYNLEARHPDEFTADLYEADTEQFVRMAMLHRQALVNPPKDTDAYLSGLLECGLKETARLLELHRDVI